MSGPGPPADIAAPLAPGIAPVEARGAVKTFGDVTAVAGIDLDVAAGEMFALVGPDGAGKTTTIRMFCGLIEPTAGTVRVLGRDPARGGPSSKNDIGYLSQRFSLYGDLTVDENIEFFAEIHGVRRFGPRREELLAFTRLAPFRERLAGRLSGGMRQKLALACTLVHTPRVIFLDEPTTGVDPLSRRDFWKILSSLLRTGITIVMTTPYLDEAERCARVALMHHGRILAAGTPQELKARMTGTVVEVVPEETRKAFKVLKDGGADVRLFGDRLNVIVGDAASGAAEIESRLGEAGIGTLDRRTIPPSLENVFISMTGSAPGADAEEGP